MITVQFFEKDALLFSQLTRNLPSVDQNIKIKGRKGKVLKVIEVNETLFQVHVLLEKVVKGQPSLMDVKKKKR